MSEFEKLPGVGPKSAQRLAFPCAAGAGRGSAQFGVGDYGRQGAYSVLHHLRQFHRWRNLRHLRRSARDDTLMCVVAEPRDLIAMEKTNEFRGKYHVLAG